MTRIFTHKDQNRLRQFVSAQRARLEREAEALSRLSAQVEGGNVVSHDEIPGDVVTMYSQVRVKDADNGRSYVMTLSLPFEHESHGAGALFRAYPAVEMLGARVGDEVAWRSAGRQRRVAIEELLFRPESSPQPSIRSPDRGTGLERFDSSHAADATGCTVAIGGRNGRHSNEDERMRI